MMISKIIVSNYKKFREKKEFQFLPGLNIIIGENNSGKTTILKLIRAFLEKDVKLFNEVKDEEKKPEIEITTIVDNEEEKASKLNTDKKTWKWDGAFEAVNCGYISANVSAGEIENNFNKFFAAELEKEEDIKSQIKSKIDLFIKGANPKSWATSVIEEKEDDYSMIDEISLKKAVTLEFNKSNPKSIINKGMGQQKEYIFNYFCKEKQISSTNFLLIDEIENSLSMNSLEKIVNNFAEMKNKQIFITTHNPTTISAIKTNQIKVLSIGDWPTHLLPNNTIFCEGVTDMQKFSQIWIKTLFLQCGGSSIIKTAENYKIHSLNFKCIVDGDDDGCKYKKEILEQDQQFKVHKLIEGSIEAYYFCGENSDKILGRNWEELKLSKKEIHKKCNFNKKMLKKELEKGTLKDYLE